MFVHSEEDLTLWQRYWANYHVLLTMVELGLFGLLANSQSCTAEEIAAELAADARAIDICGRILTNAGLLNYADGKFSLTDTARALAVPLDDLTWEWRRRENYANLLDTVRSGRPAMPTSGGLNEADEADARQFLQMQYRSSAAEVQAALNVLQQLPRSDLRPWRILDLGGGHGRYAATFARELSNVEVNVFDRPLATHLAQEIAGHGFTTRSGDFLRDDLGGPYDIVFMAHIVSGISLDDILTLFRRMRPIIPPDGFLVLEDIFVDPERSLQPDFAIDFQLRILLENEHGRFRTIPEISDLVMQAGFPSQRVHLGEGYSFIIARY